MMLAGCNLKSDYSSIELVERYILHNNLQMIDEENTERIAGSATGWR